MVETVGHRRAMPVNLTPLPQHGGNQPAGQAMCPLGERSVLDLGAKKLVRQTN
jgi:hypothetical protein